MKELTVPELQFPRIEATQEFIDKNKFVLATPEQIKWFIEDTGDNDLFGFMKQVWLEALSYEDGLPFWSDEYKNLVATGETEHTFCEWIIDTTQDFLDYLVFGFWKALDERGISAGRTIQKLSAWLLLLGREDLAAEVDDSEFYNPYWIPALIKLCIELSIPYPKELTEYLDNH